MRAVPTLRANHLPSCILSPDCQARCRLAQPSCRSWGWPWRACVSPPPWWRGSATELSRCPRCPWLQLGRSDSSVGGTLLSASHEPRSCGFSETIKWRRHSEQVPLTSMATWNCSCSFFSCSASCRQPGMVKLAISMASVSLIHRITWG